MQKYFHVIVCVLTLLGSMAPAQDSSSNRPNNKPAARQRNPEAAKEAEAEGEQLLFRKNDVKGAIENFKKSVKLDPWYAHGYMMLGVAYMQTQRWDDAQWAFEEALKIAPEDPQACLGVGSALNEQKDYAGAQKILQHCLELKTDSAEAEYELGRSLWGLSKWEPAELHVRRAIGLNKDYAGPHFLMGNIYLHNQDAESALTEFREYLRLDPEGPQAPAVRDMVAKIESALKQK
jgi:cytochrome c-type biogenesis protein CcmH/NrfG